MQSRFWLILTLTVAGTTFSGCTAVVIGGAGAIIVDEVMEQKSGGDGLF